MDKRLKLGIDMDGVVADFVSAYRREAIKLLGRDFPTTNKDWNFTDWGISKKESSQLWDIIRNSPNWFFLYPEPYPGAAETLKILTRENECFFITTRLQTAGMPIREQTQAYLDRLGVEYPNVIVTTRKGAVSECLELDAFIDDKPENLYDIWKHTPSTKLYLRSHEYNENLPDNRWTRVKDLEEFSQRIHE